MQASAKRSFRQGRYLWARNFDRAQETMEGCSRLRARAQGTDLFCYSVSETGIVEAAAADKSKAGEQQSVIAQL